MTHAIQSPGSRTGTASTQQKNKLEVPLIRSYNNNMMIEIGLETILGAGLIGYALWKTDDKLTLAMAIGGTFLVLSGRFGLLGL